MKVEGERKTRKAEVKIVGNSLSHHGRGGEGLRIPGIIEKRCPGYFPENSWCACAFACHGRKRVPSRLPRKRMLVARA